MKKETVANFIFICAIVVLVINVLILTGIISTSTSNIAIMGIVSGACLVYLSDIIRKRGK